MPTYPFIWVNTEFVIEFAMNLLNSWQIQVLFFGTLWDIFILIFIFELWLVESSNEKLADTEADFIKHPA